MAWPAAVQMQQAPCSAMQCLTSCSSSSSNAACKPAGHVVHIHLIMDTPLHQPACTLKRCISCIPLSLSISLLSAFHVLKCRGFARTSILWPMPCATIIPDIGIQHHHLAAAEWQQPLLRQHFCTHKNKMIAAQFVRFTTGNRRCKVKGACCDAVLPGFCCVLHRGWMLLHRAGWLAAYLPTCLALPPTLSTSAPAHSSCCCCWQ
jgi:hypothetical protein